MTADGMTEVTEYLESELDFPTAHYNDSYLERRLRSRMRRNGCESFTSYLSHLKSCPTEQDDLLECFSINVTSFFRNPEVWDEIHNILVHQSHEVDGTVSVWSAACADGREPYSIAMLIAADPRLDLNNFDILATDISTEALDVARTGKYVEGVTEDFCDQLSYLPDSGEYVSGGNGVFIVDSDLQDAVTFERHDLVNDSPKSGFDLVLCRNLLIYIQGEHEQEVLRTLGESLRYGGFLVLGKSESAFPGVIPGVDVVNTRKRVYRQKSR